MAKLDIDKDYNYLIVIDYASSLPRETWPARDANHIRKILNRKNLINEETGKLKRIRGVKVRIFQMNNISVSSILKEGIN